MYRDWERLAELQGKDGKYFDEALADFELARQQGGSCAVYATLRIYLRRLHDDERDAA